MKRIWLGLAGVLLVGVVATAVFILVQQLSGEQTIGDQPLSLALPTEPADLMGGLLEFGNGRLLLGSGMVDIHPDGSGDYATDHDGPEMEILIDEAMQFFADVTQSGAGQASNGSISVQQQVEAVAQPDSLPYPAFISIWGEPRDDEFYARIVLFDVPGD